MKLSDIKRVAGGEIINSDAEFCGAAYDSRNVKKGNLFVCLKGERADGHDYFDSAFASGASCTMCEKRINTDKPYILVEDSLKAFQSAATEYKSALGVLTAAVTGSVGKTTTKEFLSAVLSEKFKVHKTEGNKNSNIGLPATILDMPSDSTAAVFEMGMSNFGEISLLSEIARPDIAVITNIGYCHIEFLGSRENILKAKLEIVDGMSENGTLILNADDEYLCKVDKNTVKQKLLFVGIGNPKAEYSAEDILFTENNTRFLAVTPNGNFEVSIPTEGIHNVYNALSAIAVGQTAKMTNGEIASGLLNFKNAPLRQNIYETNGMTVIEDCYNASPTSVSAAIKILLSKQGRKIAVLGDMLELGSESEKLHEMTGRELAGVDVLVAFGNFRESYIKGAETVGVHEKNCYSCRNTVEAAETLCDIAKKGDVILFKASRGMQAEDIIKKFIK